MFKSARLMLTLFYLGVIVLFNLMVTLSVRVYAEHEFLRSNIEQRTEVKEWAARFFDMTGGRPEVAMRDIQDTQAEIVRQHLNQGLLVINLYALAIGGLLSYWFAGRALRPLQEAHEAQARFTADASHELRTPLANMRLENEIFLRQRRFSEAEAREQIASNLEEVQRLERLSSNLLALHQYGQAALVRTAIPVKRMVDESLAQVRAAAGARHVHIETDMMPARIVGHHDSLVQLMDILLDNAIKYGPQGGRVMVRGQKRNGIFVISVQDEGPGITQHDLPRIFDRLYRGDKARSAKVGGYGLGLALAKEITEANSATILVRNLPDRGACFEVTLRLAP